MLGNQYVHVYDQLRRHLHSEKHALALNGVLRLHIGSHDLKPRFSIDTVSRIVKPKPYGITLTTDTILVQPSPVNA
jgi:hypothetical protein